MDRERTGIDISQLQSAQEMGHLSARVNAIEEAQRGQRIDIKDLQESMQEVLCRLDTRLRFLEDERNRVIGKIAGAFAIITFLTGSGSVSLKGIMEFFQQAATK